MNRYAFLFGAVFFFYCGKALSLDVSPEVMQKLGEKIWENECGGKIDKLCHWNQGENFASLGIGHFIWYPKNHRENFQETFPDLLVFLQAEGVILPNWLADAQGCPWKSRDEFYQNMECREMLALRQLLVDTRDMQAKFMAVRLEKALPEMTKGLPLQKKKDVMAVFQRLAQEMKGLYALIDYSNFKGMGTSPSESYHGQRWGLLQVLEKISPSSQHVLEDFVASAKELLRLRVKNSPPERHEEQWLKGWLSRVETYR